MTTGEPASRFEVYPPAAEAVDQPNAAEPTWEQPDPAPVVERYEVTPYVPPPIPPPTAGPSRRGVVGLIVAVPVVVIGLASFNRSSTTTSYEWEEPGDNTWTDDTDTPTMWVGTDGFQLPDGWEATQVSDTEAVATKDGNRVQAYGFTADPADGAVDLVAALVTRRFGEFKGTIGKPVDESDEDLQQATVRGTGKVSGKAARLVGTLWIDGAANARLALRVVTAAKDSDTAQEARDIFELLRPG